MYLFLDSTLNTSVKKKCEWNCVHGYCLSFNANYNENNCSYNMKPPEEKKNTMENMIQIHCPTTGKICSSTGCSVYNHAVYCSLAPNHPTSSSGSVAAPKEDEPWYITQAKQCEESAEKLRAKIIELQDKELTSLRQQLAEHTAINSLLAGDEPEVTLANEVFRLKSELAAAKESIKELIPIAEDRLFSVPVKSLDSVNEIVSRAKALLDKQ